MQLSETDAYAILQAHCSALYGRLVFLERERHDTHSVRKRIAIECLQLTDDQVNSGLGVQLRLALDIVNAMCCCVGLEPHKNLRFWRHAVCSLWIKYPTRPRDESWLANGREVFTPEPSEFLPFDAAAFSEFSICVLNSEERGLTARWVSADELVVEQTGRWSSSHNAARGMETLSELMSVLRLPETSWITIGLVQLTVTSLTIESSGSLKRISAVALRSLLKSCGNLRRLDLDRCATASIEPLVSAYTDRMYPCRVSALDLSGESVGARLSLVPLMGMLGDPIHPGARVLTQLTLDGLSWPKLKAFVELLRVNRSLSQICLGFNGVYPRYLASEAAQKVALGTLLGPFDGEILVDGRGPRLGLLSVLQSQQLDGSPLSEALSRVDSAVLRTIFGFVGPTVVRRMSWRHRMPPSYNIFDE